MTKSAKELRKAFKQCENPYRRGVVSVKQFQVSEAHAALKLCSLARDSLTLMRVLMLLLRLNNNAVACSVLPLSF